jgi:hypothetical protein
VTLPLSTTPEGWVRKAVCHHAWKWHHLAKHVPQSSLPRCFWSRNLTILGAFVLTTVPWMTILGPTIWRESNLLYVIMRPFVPCKYRKTFFTNF